MQDEPTKSSPLDAGSMHPLDPVATSSTLPNGSSIDEALDELADDSRAETPASPAWANDLRKLYDAVVEEPLPDSLIDLLSKLDSAD